MVSLHRGRFVVVHRVTDVQVFLSTPRIFPEGQIFTKNYHFWRFLEPYGHIFKATTVKFGMRVRSWGSLPQAKFCKNDLRDISLWGKFIPKSTIFGDFWAVSPHLLSQSGKNLVWGCEPGRPSPCQILQKLVKGVYPFFAKLYKN